MKSFLGQKINWSIVILVIIAAFGVTLSKMMEYKNEGEKNMPVNLNKVLIVSTAGAESKDDDNKSKWNLSIDQYNDIYLYFEENNGFEKNDYVESISIENINITKQPKIGSLELYMPNSTGDKNFSYEDRYKISNSLTYNGANTDDIKALQISRNGGTLLFRIANRKVGEFVSDNDEEITYDGSLLTKTGVNLEDLAGTINFDIVIKTNKTAYRGNLTLDFPNEKMKEEGVSQKTIDKELNVIFKRERK